MASIRVGSLEYATELQLAGFDIKCHKNPSTGRIETRASIPGIAHRKLRSIANRVWKNTLEIYGYYYLKGTDNRFHTVPCFARRVKAWALV